MASESVDVDLNFGVNPNSAAVLEAALEQLQQKAFSKAVAETVKEQEKLWNQKSFGQRLAGQGMAGATGAAGFAADIASSFKSAALTGSLGGGILGTVGGAVGAHNPAVMEQFDRVLKDINGVVGQSLIPVMQGLIPIFRSFGDLLQQLIGKGSVFGDGLQAFGKWLEKHGLGNEETYTYRPGGDAQDEKRGFFSVGGRTLKKSEISAEELARPDFDKYYQKSGGSSVGAAAHGANYSSFLEAGQGLRMAAFGGAKSTDQQIAENTRMTAEALKRIEDIRSRVRRGPEWNDNAAQEHGQAEGFFGGGGGF